MAVMHQYVADCKSQKKFKVWPGQAADLLGSHRDGVGNWVTEAVGAGKWEKQPNTVYTSLSPLPLMPNVRRAGKRAIVTSTSLGKRKQSISDDTHSDPDSDSDSDLDFAPAKRSKPQSRQGGTVALKAQKKSK